MSSGSAVTRPSPAAARAAAKRRERFVACRDSLILLLIVGFCAYRFIDWTFLGTLDVGLLLKWAPALAVGALMSLSITACAVVLGLVLGVAIAMLLYVSGNRVVQLILNAYIEIWRNTPLIVLMFWVHFGLPTITGISTTAFVSGFLALALQSSAYLADIARGGIRAVDNGQWAAAYALGLPARSRWLEIILPQAFRIMIPALSNLAISFLNASALLGLLHVGELMTVSAKISDYTMHPIEIMTATALFYLACNLMISAAAALWEKRIWRGTHGH